MGLLDFLFGGSKYTRVEVEPVRVWMSGEEKLDGIVREVGRRVAEGVEVVLVVAHFDDVLRELEERVPEFSQATVGLRLSSEIGPELVRPLRLDETTSLDIIVAERHPLLSVDESLEQAADALPCRSRLTPHVSLDDPLLKRFGGDQMRGMLESLGMVPGESIRSKMLARRIQAAQKKVEQQAYGDVRADSAEEWLEINCR